MSLTSRACVAAAVCLITAAPALRATAQARTPPRGRVDLELRLDEPGEYRASIEAEGETRACSATLTRGRPCSLTGVPVGRAQVHLTSGGESGAHRVSTLALVRGQTEALVVRNGISLDGAYGFTLLGLSVLFAAPGVYLAIATDCTVDDRDCKVTPALAGVLITLGAALAITGICLLTFGDPFALYAADARRENRPAVSPEPTINVPVPPRPPDDRSSRAPARGFSGAILLGASRLVLTLRF